MKHLLFLLLLGASCLFVQGQETKNLDLQEKSLNLEEVNPGITKPVEGARTIVPLDQEFRLEAEALKRKFNRDIVIEIVDISKEATPLKKEGDLVVPPEESKETLIKQLLGDVYAEVGHMMPS